MHPEKAEKFIANTERYKWHDQALWFVREKRDRMAQSVAEWEELREVASKIKLHTLSKLDFYLKEFEKNAIALGAKVYWAKDGTEHNKIVLEILEKHSAKKVVKSKSMLTEECGLNHFLEAKGIEVTDTDLGEWLVQLRKEPPSHIVLPAIHIKKEEVSELFQEKYNTEKGNYDPKYLTDVSREILRAKFLEAEVAVTGVNFAVAESGAVVVCTNEGNADMGTSMCKVHIACMGIEKLIPRHKDLGVFLRLLARSATGQPITTYSSHFMGPITGGELHIVLVDNGRTAHLGEKDFSSSLSCIRCGACMNTCPVYRRSGGYSYNYTIPGPIGSILAPLKSIKEHSSLPFASSLCGSCTDVCPVKINLHEQLLFLRKRIVQRGEVSFIKKVIMKFTAKVLVSSSLFDLIGYLALLFLKFSPRFMIYNRFNIWGKKRELPKIKEKSFKEIYQEKYLKVMNE